MFVTSIMSCSSSGQTSGVVRPDPTSPVAEGFRADLEFRAVRLTTPKIGDNCPDPGSLASVPAGVIVTDRSAAYCYLLGPVLLTSADIHSATVLATAALEWAVHLQFKDNKWVSKVARPFVNKRVAIVLDGVVQAALRIEPGFAADDIDVLGSPARYSRSEAIAVAATIRGVAPSKVRVRSVDPTSP